MALAAGSCRQCAGVQPARASILHAYPARADTSFAAYFNSSAALCLHDGRFVAGPGHLSHADALTLAILD